MFDSALKPSEIVENPSNEHRADTTTTSTKTADDDPDSDDGYGAVMRDAEERTTTVSTPPPSDVDKGASSESTPPLSDVDKGASSGSTSPTGDADNAASTGSTSPPSNAENVEPANSPGTRKRRNRKQIRDDEVAALELALAQAKARREAFQREQAELAADTMALQSGRELAGALLQKAVAAEDPAAAVVWDALTRRAASADARRMAKMRAILAKRGHARREGSDNQAAPGQCQVDPGEASATA